MWLFHRLRFYLKTNAKKTFLFFFILFFYVMHVHWVVINYSDIPPLVLINEIFDVFDSKSK